jgi:hypothetical protein
LDAGPRRAVTRSAVTSPAVTCPAVTRRVDLDDARSAFTSRAPCSYVALVLFFVALSCLAAATFGSVVLYQRGERRRLEAGERPLPRLLGPGADAEGDPASARSSSSKAASKASSKKHASTPPAAVDDEPTLQTLAPGDIVEDGADDWLVAGTVTYREEGDVWALHALEGGTKQRFLEVRTRRGDVEVAFVDAVDGLPRGQLLSGLSFRGHSFQLEGRGDARTTARGDVVGLSSGGTLEWTRYGAVGGALLLVEDEGAARRAFLGQRVPASSLSVMSGALNRAVD